MQAALLCIYDLSKGTDPVLRIGDVTLLEKEGGKSGFWQHPQRAARIQREREVAPSPYLKNMRVTVVTISDSCYEGSAEDRSGHWLVERCEASGGMISKHYLVPDEVDSIRQVVMEAV